MPELPDIEGYRRQLARDLPGRRIQHVHVLDAGILRNSSASSFARRLNRRRFDEPARHGKWLLLPTDGPTVIVHSGMTGRPYFTMSTTEPDRYDRLCIELDRGELRYADLRKLRGIWLAADEIETADIIGAAGPDALTIGLDEFAATLANTRRRLKTALTDQSVIAGLGNLLSDEICWQAHIHPLRLCARLDATEVRTLHSVMRRVLRTSVRLGQVPRLRSWLTGRRDDSDARCPRCGTRLSRARNSGRMTLWCPRCQPH